MALAFSLRTGGLRHFVRWRHKATITGVGTDLDFYLNNSTTTAYVVNQTSNTLQVFDVSNPAAPTLLATLTTGTNPHGVAAPATSVRATRYGRARPRERGGPVPASRQ
ncbi:MAG: hypothetical protein M3Y54_03970 [Bacteroidota bacterium]|nr:hypothetical protein [Bacteroidota bacterium]